MKEGEADSHHRRPPCSPEKVEEKWGRTKEIELNRRRGVQFKRRGKGSEGGRPDPPLMGAAVLRRLLGGGEEETKKMKGKKACWWRGCRRRRLPWWRRAYKDGGRSRVRAEEKKNEGKGRGVRRRVLRKGGGRRDREKLRFCPWSFFPF